MGIFRRRCWLGAVTSSLLQPQLSKALSSPGCTLELPGKLGDFVFSRSPQGIHLALVLKVGFPRSITWEQQCRFPGSTQSRVCHTILPGDADAGWRLGGTPTCGVQRVGGASKSKVLSRGGKAPGAGESRGGPSREGPSASWRGGRAEARGSWCPKSSWQSGGQGKGGAGMPGDVFRLKGRRGRREKSGSYGVRSGGLLH